MRILISNDDGIEAEGLQALVRRLSAEHDVYVAAPDRQRSAYSHSVTYFLRDLHAQPVQLEGTVKAWALDGTPADCVYAGICGLMDEKPDLVISGINHGWNVSMDCIYSGTVGAASEGTILGIPSMAVSLASVHKMEFDTSAEVTARLIGSFLQDPARYDYILNVNVPPLHLEEIKGCRAARFDGRRMYARKLDVIESGTGFTLHCPLIQIPVDEHGRVEDGDLSLIEEGYVTLSPILLDWVDKDKLDHVRNIAQQY